MRDKASIDKHYKLTKFIKIPVEVPELQQHMEMVHHKSDQQLEDVAYAALSLQHVIVAALLLQLNEKQKPIIKKKELSISTEGDQYMECILTKS